jgi:hypothetical protein
MQIEIRQTKEDGIVQIITLDERWYSKEKQAASSCSIHRLRG